MTARERLKRAMRTFETAHDAKFHNHDHTCSLYYAADALLAMNDALAARLYALEAPAVDAPKADTPKPTGERMSAERRAEIDKKLIPPTFAVWSDLIEVCRELRDELRRVEDELQAARKPRPLSDAAVRAAFNAWRDAPVGSDAVRLSIEAADRVRATETEQSNAD